MEERQKKDEEERRESSSEVAMIIETRGRWSGRDRRKEKSDGTTDRLDKERRGARQENRRRATDQWRELRRELSLEDAAIQDRVGI